MPRTWRRDGYKGLVLRELDYWLAFDVKTAAFGIGDTPAEAIGDSVRDAIYRAGESVTIPQRFRYRILYYLLRGVGR